MDNHERSAGPQRDHPQPDGCYVSQRICVVTALLVRWAAFRIVLAPAPGGIRHRGIDAVKTFGKVIAVMVLALALIQATVPHPFPAHVAPFMLALLGLIYGGAVIDGERATDFIVVVIGVGAASATDVLSYIYVLGPYLDAMLDQLCIALYASVVTVLATRTANRLGWKRRGSDPQPAGLEGRDGGAQPSSGD